jgi:hypothetical protein
MGNAYGYSAPGGFPGFPQDFTPFAGDPSTQSDDPASLLKRIALADESLAADNVIPVAFQRARGTLAVQPNNGSLVLVDFNQIEFKFLTFQTITGQIDLIFSSAADFVQFPDLRITDVMSPITIPWPHQVPLQFVIRNVSTTIVAQYAILATS